jgi:ribose transport system permease protein
MTKPPAINKLNQSTRLLGGWEFGLLALMAALYAGGVLVNPTYFFSGDAMTAVFRDGSRVGILACGMMFVMVAKELDLSVGSTMGVVCAAFALCYSPSYLDLGIGPAIAVSIAAGLLIGLLNGFLTTILLVPAFIATLTMLFIGRGLVLALTAGRSIGFIEKARSAHWFFALGEKSPLGFYNQTAVFVIVALVAMVLLARTRWGYETYAAGGNDVASAYAGLPVRWIKARAYLLSSITAIVAGLLFVAQTKGVDSNTGLGLELIVIAATIVGGGAIAGGRGRVAGACLGAVFIVLVDVVLRQGVPMVRTVLIDGVMMTIRQDAQLPSGAVPAFIGLILVLAVAAGPYLTVKRPFERLLAWIAKRPFTPGDSAEVAVAPPVTRGFLADDRAFNAHGLSKLLHRRDAAAVILMIALWIVGLWLRPDFWGSVSNTFNLALSFTEIAFLSIGLAVVMANGDVDLSVGSVLALSASTAAFAMQQLHLPPAWATLLALSVGTAAGLVNGVMTVRYKMPAFVATLGMYYMARGVAAWLTAGQQLSGIPANYTLIGRKLLEILQFWGMVPTNPFLLSVVSSVSAQTLIMAALAAIAGIAMGHTVIGQMVYATGGNIRAASYAGVPVGRVRLLSLMFSAFCSAVAGVIYVAYLRSFNPAAGLGRELDGIASVIIGGGSIFGGYGSVIGALAGAAVITLIRGILSLQIILADGSSFVMPQHWVNVLVGVILIVAVVGDIWLRQRGMLSSLRSIIFARDKPLRPAPEAPVQEKRVT